MGSEAVWLSPVGKKRNTGRGKWVPRALVSSSICFQFYLFVNPNDQNLMHQETSLNLEREDTGLSRHVSHYYWGRGTVSSRP
ncbi:hypothetical protein YC2023_035765 [Brassica napus]